MDLRRLRVGEWIAAASGAALIVSLWLPWWKVPVPTAPDGGQPTGSAFRLADVEVSAWEALSIADVLLCLLGVLAIGLLVLTATARAAGPGVTADALMVPLALAMTVVCALRLLDPPDDFDLAARFAAEPTTAYGAWIALAATIGVLVGALVAMRDERLASPGRPTDQTGVPVDEPVRVERLPGPPAA
jgi:hypothetical protein